MVIKIADEIKRSLDSITNWAESWETVLLSLIFNKRTTSVLDSIITTYANTSDWVSVTRVKRIAEFCGYNSQTIEEKTKQFLTNIPMFTTAPIPKTITIDEVPYFTPDYAVVLNGFRWAKELNHETTRWNPTNAFNKLLQIRVSQEYPFFGCNPDTGGFYRVFSTERWHESAAMINTFLIFSKLLIPLADEYTLWEWGELNKIYWMNNHYNYSPDMPNWEMAAATTFFYVTKMYIYIGRVLGEFHRVIDDIEVRYLKDDWSSPQWGGYNVPVHHYPDNLQRSLDYYTPVLGLIHMLYPKLSDDGKSKFRGMLDGSIEPRMADALLSSDLYYNPRFTHRSGQSPWDTATAYGCTALFLMGIIPDTGSLAIPVRIEGMEQREITFLDPNHFSFNYEKRQIKIPVYAGKLSFQFGTRVVSKIFDYDGVYTVNFTDDWDDVTSFNWIDGLHDEYLEQPTSIPDVLTQTLALTMVVVSMPIIIRIMRELFTTAKEVTTEMTGGM